MRALLALPLVSALLLAACGRPVESNDDDDDVAAADDAESVPFLIDAALLREYSRVDPVFLDLTRGMVWVVTEDAMPLLGHAVVICPDGVRAFLDAWTLRQERNVGVDLAHGFFVTGTGELRATAACQMECHRCPDGAMVCVPEGACREDGADLEVMNVEQDHSGDDVVEKERVPDCADPNNDDDGDDRSSGDTGGSSGSDDGGSSGSSGGSSSGGSSSSSSGGSSTGSAGSSAGGGASGGGGQGDW
ncbi:MAG: hypothetical protein Q8O67_09150 [Deltaproteobacteria bacterium]|nr:hypothetical protein [Deltaproteobacteria bacterium]